jgi:hypothetical protein
MPSGGHGGVPSYLLCWESGGHGWAPVGGGLEGGDQSRVQLGVQIDVQVVDAQGRPQQRTHRPVQVPSPPPAGSREQVSTGSSATSAGWSHSCETPTSSPPAPRAQTISVADGSSDTTRKLHLRIMHRRRQASLAPGWPRQGGRGDPTVAG